MKRAFGSESGFTLIELLVVVLIIGILAAIALPTYQQAVAKARFANLKPMVKAFKDAEEVYYMANGSYSTDFDDIGVDVSGFTKHTSESCPTTNVSNQDGTCHKISNGTYSLSTRGIGQVSGMGVIGTVMQQRGTKREGASYTITLDNVVDHPSLKAGARMCRAICEDTSCVWYKICASETGQRTHSSGGTPDPETGYNQYTFKYKN